MSAIFPTVEKSGEQRRCLHCFTLIDVKKQHTTAVPVSGNRVVAAQQQAVAVLQRSRCVTLLGDFRA